MSTQRELIDYQLLGKNIRESREKRQMTQLDVARRLGVHESYVGKMEKGISKPNMERLAGLCRVLETTMEQLLKCTVESENPYLGCSPTDDEYMIEIRGLLFQCRRPEMKEVILNVCRQIMQLDNVM